MPKLFHLAASLGSIALLGGAYSLLANARTAETSYTLVPSPLQGQALNTCYPTTFHPPDQVRYVDTGNGHRYYEAVAKPRFATSTPYATLYIRTGADTCRWLNRNDLTSGRLAFMPAPAAIALAKLQYTEILNQCRQTAPPTAADDACQWQLEAEINQPPNWKAPQVNYLFPDDAAALKALGIRTYRVLVIRSIKDLERLRPRTSQPDKR